MKWYQPAQILNAPRRSATCGKGVCFSLTQGLADTINRVGPHPGWNASGCVNSARQGSRWRLDRESVSRVFRGRKVRRVIKGRCFPPWTESVIESTSGVDGEVSYGHLWKPVP